MYPRRRYPNTGSVAGFHAQDQMEWLAQASPQELLDFTHSGQTELPSIVDPSINALLRGTARSQQQIAPIVSDVGTQQYNKWLEQQNEERKKADLMRMYLMQSRGV